MTGGKGVGASLLVGALWFVSAALATWALLTLHRLCGLLLGLVLTVDPTHTVASAWRAITLERLALIVLVIAWMVALVYLSAYYRSSIRKARLWRAFGRVTVIELLTVALGYLLPRLIL